MGLQAYQAKRDFQRTREPRGSAAASTGGHSFVVQQHAARRLHYDFRLELDGVLKSWAVTRGPSLVPGEKRLAVEVEDHPIEYGDFEGTIAEGEYGAGAVIVWDRGVWTPLGDPRRGLAEGHLDFVLHGEKLKGRWALVRMAPRRGVKRSLWLLIKARDEEAREASDPDILTEAPRSVVSGREIGEVGQGNKARRWRAGAARNDGAAAPKRVLTQAASRAANAAAGYAAIPGATKRPMPRFVAPCLATLSREPPEGEDWEHEVKFDGYRLQARVESGKVALYTRGGLDWTAKFGPAVARALAALPVASAFVDGEMVAEGKNGVSDFALPQQALSEGRDERLRYCAFDLLYADGYDLRKAALVDRRAALAGLLAHADAPLRFSSGLAESGAAALRIALRKRLEGVVSKRKTSPYRSGRGADWIKAKCRDRQEFVIAGYVPSSAAARAIGALALGYYEDGALVYAGRAGTGFSREAARALYERLAPTRIGKQPFARAPAAAAMRGVVWIKPQFLAEIEFRGWTRARLLRQAAFHGLREDKPAAEVKLERPVADPPAAPAKARGHAFTATLTHPDRVFWPDVGLTKQGLADYYADVWTQIAPHIVARPLALLRCPDGVDGKRFFQKRAWRGRPDSVSVIANQGAGGDSLLAVEGLDGLIALVQAGALEIHPWGATVGDLDHPDRLIFDLDPGPRVAGGALADAAREVRERLARDGVASFVKTSGGKGLHVVAPLVPQADWAAAHAYAKGVAEAMANARPDQYIATASKVARDHRIFVDYLRNSRGATAVAPYSTRARVGAPVSTPVAWEELRHDLRGDVFKVADVRARLSRLAADPWAAFFKLEQSLPAAPTPSARRKSDEA